tara:strand:- start:13387 stop:15243 length:1857 start_codon:yes stop_codon:yes gene_type:complete
MASSIANIILILSIFFSFLSNLFFFKKKFTFSIQSFNLSSVLAVFSFCLLIFYFTSSNFSVSAVYENSHTLKPFFYKLSGTWGNHEGSLLLFILIVGLYGTLFSLIYDKNIKLKSWVIFFQNNIFLIFLVFLVVKSNPFDLIVPTPMEGLGLNPILQDPLLVIHPPFLYLGYVGFSLTLSLVLAALITRQLDNVWAQISWPWVLSSWVFLTIGISLGSIWAYYELGWGGYWFWDPVENASLMPWLASTALIHSLLVLKIKNKMQNWTAILAILTFSLSLLGTFLVRSGILNSVHAFANDPDRGVFILVIIFFITTISLLIHIFYSSKTLSNKITFFSKESFLNINNLFLLFFLFVILLGTIYPIILSAIGETISIGPDYYNTILAPFIFIFLIAMTVGPILKWSQDIEIKKIYFLSIIFIIALLTSLFIIIFSKRNELTLLLGFVTSIFLIFTIIYETFRAWHRIYTINFARLCSHLGVGIFILSIFLNSYFSKTKDFEIHIGETREFDNLTLNFTNHEIYKINNYLEMKTDFEISDGNQIFTLKPSIRRYFQPDQITSETSIKPTLLSNHYLVINFPDLNSKVIGARYYFNFFIHGIWFGLLLIIFGGILSVFKKRI